MRASHARVLLPVALVMGLCAGPVRGDAPAAAPAETEPATERVARYLVVPLPIAGSVDLNVRKLLDQTLSELPKQANRPILVLEFRPREGQSGEGSEFERALALARYLAGERVRGVRTVAYLPATVRGHAVLPILACEEIIMSPDALLGEAGIDEEHIDPTVRRGYAEIADRRRTIPANVALGMLDKDLTVYRVQTGDGTRYVLQDELDQLTKESAVTSVETVVPAGQLAKFTGRDLRLKYSFVSHLVEDRGQLANALHVPPRSLEEDPSRGEGWKPIRIDISGPIHEKNVNWIERSLREQISSGNVNFVCVVIDSPGGSLLQSVRLANYLSSLPAGEVRTVAYVEREARGDAALIAWACDQLVIAEGAILGGPGAATIRQSALDELKETLQSVGRTRHRDWSLPQALVDPSVRIFRFERQDHSDLRFLSEDEFATLEDSASWIRGGEVDVAAGISGSQAVELRLARFTAHNFDELRQLYHLEETLPSIEPNWAHVLVEYLASPQLAGTLLFIGCFTLMVEFTSPGIGVPGFVSGICFLLFFWANFLHGTAGWLEVLLFLSGVSCILLEIFVLPGVGVFGAGGAIMVVASLILASQTFIIPRNAYQLAQIPSSLFMVVAAGGGVLVSLAVFRRYLHEAPVFNRMMLEPPDEERLEELNRRETLVDWSFLVGKCGVTTTELVPGGKARFGDDLVDVMSEAEVIEPGTRVCVVEAQGNRVVVRPVTLSNRIG